MTTLAPTTWAPPRPEDMWYRDNFRDHLGHDVVNWATVDETNRICIDMTSERFTDEPDFTIFIVKNIESSTQSAGMYCNTCHEELDIPNEAVWNT